MSDKILGRFRRGHFPDLFLDAAADLMNVQLTKAHEGVHRVLEYSSAHGLLLTFLIELSKLNLSHHPLSADLNEIIRLMHEAEFLVQEGCATLLTLNACMAGFGKAQADRLAQRLPQDYRAATALVSDCFSAIHSNRTLGPFLVKTLEFLVHGIALAAMNGTICTEFSTPDTMTAARVRAYLMTNSPTVRLTRIRDYLSIQPNAEAYVRFCADTALLAVGGLPLFDQNFMREYITKHPLQWEECHRHLEFEMRMQLVGWLCRQGAVDVDPSYATSFSDLTRWSPLVSIKKWEHQLGVHTGLLDLIESPSKMPIERHIPSVHSVNYSLEDKRRVLVSGNRRHREQAIVRISREATHAVSRVIYVPIGEDFPEMGIKGSDRLILDLAVYRGLVSLGATLRVDGVSIADAQRFVAKSVSNCFMTSLYNYQQMEADVAQAPRALPELPVIHIFFTPGDFDIQEHIQTMPGPFLLKHSTSFRVRRDWADDVELPGVIEMEEQFRGRRRVYFCIADGHLLGSYRELLSRQPKVQDQGALVSDHGRRCAIEACYGFDSVLDRSEKGVYEV